VLLLDTQDGHKMITNIEKIQIMQDRINTMNLHVMALREDISQAPLGDHVEKPTRQSVLDNILGIINALEIEKTALTNQG
jgi:hypothetical protein